MSSTDGVSTVTTIFQFDIEGFRSRDVSIFNTITEIEPFIAYKGNSSINVPFRPINLKANGDERSITGDELPHEVTITYSSYGLDSSGLNPETYIPPLISDSTFELAFQESAGKNNADITDKSSSNQTITVGGDSQQSSFTPYQTDLSVQFEGGETLGIGSSTDFAFSTNNFTIETWVKPDTSSFYLLESSEDFGVHLGYNIDSQDQGLLLGLAGLTAQESSEEVAQAYALGGDRTYEITENGIEYTVHEFTNTAQSTLEVVGNLEAEILTVAGGGGAGSGNDDGGGGAGGLLFQPSVSFSTGNYNVKVGAGGAANTNGDDSFIASSGGTDLSRALGGGAGGNSGTPQGSDGGSGGGGEASSGSNNPGGLALQPTSVFGGFGNAGELSGTTTGTPYEGAGGGGAGAPGSRPGGSKPGNGGDGLNEVTLESITYNFYSMFGPVGEVIDGQSWFAGGGAGGGETASGSGVAGGKGGGGAYDKQAVANTGGGGGAYDDDSPQSDTQPGGSGVIYIRYPKVIPPLRSNLSNEAQEGGIEYQDQSIEKTRFLLRANGTGTNSDFVDSSTFQRSLTIQGNTVQSGLTALTPNKWSYRFDGSNDYFYSGEVWDSLTNITDPWTLEFWMHLNTTTSTDNIPIGVNSKSSGSNVFLYTGGNVNINGTNLNISSNLDVYTWAHVALVFDGSTIKVYHDGVEVYSNSATWSTSFANCYLSVGAEFDGGNAGSPGNYTPCFITDMRASSSAIYTANFVPPTALLEKTADTIFLSLRQNHIYDESDNTAAILYGNSPKAYPFSIFKPEAEYDLTVHGGSAVFDGSGDGIDPGFQLPATGDFTFETWFKTDSVARHNLFGQYNSGVGRTLFYVNPDQSYRLEFFSSGDGNYNPWHIRSNDPIQPFQWYHTALVRSGNVFSMYLNGVLQGTMTSSHSLESRPFTIGYSSQSVMNGYMTDTHVTFSAKYSADFAVPTSVTEADADTQLLLHYANPNIWDLTANSDIQLFGNTTASTTVTKYAGSSVYFDGSGDYIRADEVFNGIGSGTPWTAECWLYLTRNPSSGNDYFFALNSAGNGNNNMIVSGPDVWVNNSSRGNLSSSITSANTWYHVAIVYDGSQVEIFVDGVSAFTYGAALNFAPSGQTFAIGGEFDAANGGSPGNYFQGYIEDYRVTIGEARYTGNFTPPTEGYQTLTQLDPIQPGVPPTAEEIQDVVYGRDLEFYIDAVGFADGASINYEITGVTSSDINGGSLTGTLTVNGEQAFLLVETSSNNSIPKTLTFTVTYPDGVTDLDIVNLVNDDVPVPVEETIDVITDVGTTSWTAPQGIDQVEYLIVAGGGGGAGVIGGGGGAGGLLYGTTSISGNTNYDIVIGSGGLGGFSWNSSSQLGESGENSSAFGFTAIGGGGGGAYGGNDSRINGLSGGSGGGAGQGGIGGSGTTGQGNDGGLPASSNNGGGGGGAGAVGADAVNGVTGGDGGVGLYYGDIFGDQYGENGYFAAGGGGGTRSGFGTGGSGGLGGGGSGGTTDTVKTSTDGVANTGGGGGGGGHNGHTAGTVRSAGNGGTGVVLLKYGTSGKLLASSSAVQFGDAIVYSVNDPSLSDGTVISYSISGVTAADIVGGQLTGTMQMKSGVTSININTDPSRTGLKLLTFTITLPDTSTESKVTRVFTPIAVQGGGTLTLNDWNHIAVSRYFNEYTFYINGTKTQAAQTVEVDYGSTEQSLVLGRNFSGLMRDFHITTNFAKYLNDFQTPEQAIDSQSGTVLLTCQPSIEGKSFILDLSSQNQTVTVSEGITAEYDSPYPRSRYASGQNLGSVRFDDNEFITITPAANFSLGTSTTPFTFEVWLYPRSTGGSIMCEQYTASGETIVYAFVMGQGGTSMETNGLYPSMGYYNGSAWNMLSSTSQISLNEWTHVAFVFDGSQCNIYLNGTLDSSGGPSTWASGGTFDIDNLYLGRRWDTANDAYFNGSMADVRFVIGSAVYTADFIPPQEPLTDITNTVLLLNFDDPAVFDDNRRTNVALYNGATVNTSTVNESSASIDLTGTKYAIIDETYLPVDFSNDLEWRLDFDVYVNSYIEDRDMLSFGHAGYAPFMFYFNDGDIAFYSSSNNASWNIAENVDIITNVNQGWYKISLRRNNTSYTVHVDDSQVLSYTVNGTFNTPNTRKLALGARVNGDNPSDIFIENLTVRTNSSEAEPFNVLGFTSLVDRESSRNVVVDNQNLPSPNIEVKYYDDKISSSNFPEFSISTVGTPVGVRAFRNIKNLLLSVNPNGELVIQDTTQDNDPTLDRNPVQAGEEQTGQTVEVEKDRRLWF